ncbi:MAG: leucine-rich repeat protein [Treponema sp.]|jgi:formylglycine-generating enzyme required for sulfatase activity|nr:leucine-rich repeat protein [Treponema sp.]
MKKKLALTVALLLATTAMLFAQQYPPAVLWGTRQVDNGITIGGYLIENPIVVIPDRLPTLQNPNQLLPVTAIGDFVFEGSNITSVTIPEGVKNIGRSAFKDCKGLTSIKLPNTITGISDGAFDGCINLTSINIPDQIMYIGISAFAGCSKLTNIEISDVSTAVEIASGAFAESGLRTITIGTGLRSIGNYAFRNSKLESITIRAVLPSRFGSYVFQGISNLKIMVPASALNAYKAAAGWKDYANAITAIGAAAATPVQNTMVQINAGTFTMGSPANEPERGANETQRSVTLSAFSIGKYQVTQKEYEEIMGINPSVYKGPNLPVENVTWYDAIEYCNKRSSKEGLTPAYNMFSRTPATGYPIKSATVTWTQNANGYRLPTVAEWEYACRAGTTTAFHTGATISDNTAWYGPNSGAKTNEVGKKAANAWGLFDMHGNVYELCWDWFGNYNTTAETNPLGPASGTARVIRGGTWSRVASFQRSAARANASPDLQGGIIGFRVARGVVPVVATLPAAPPLNPVGNFSVTTFFNTITISGYSGTSTTMNIPQRIQNMPVFSIRSIQQSEAGRNVRSVVLPEGLMIIEQNAFQYCSALTTVTLPSTIGLIRDNAFANTSLTTVYILAVTPPKLEANVFTLISLSMRFHVPMASVNAYKTAPGWSNFANYIVGMEMPAPTTTVSAGDKTALQRRYDLESQPRQYAPMDF